MSHADRSRIVLRPYANPLPLGLFSFAVGMALLGMTGLGVLSSATDLRTSGLLMAVFVFPLELLACIIALLARDTAVGTVLGLYATSWIGLGLVTVLDPTGQPNRSVGVFLAAFAIMLVPLVGGATLGKVSLAVLVTVSAVRAVLQAAWELGAPHGLDTAQGITALVVLALAVGVGTSFLLEDLRGRTPLVPRRGAAAAATTEPPAEQAGHGMPEPGLRDQL